MSRKKTKPRNSDQQKPICKIKTDEDPRLGFEELKRKPGITVYEEHRHNPYE